MAEGASPSEEESLVDLLNRATNPSNREDDLTAIQAFVEKVKANKDGPQMAVRLLAHKMQSPQEREALQGLTVLDNCVQKCDGRFHQEIGKFRFLNEMIKIVSPKYLGNLTTENVKHKTSRLMFTWTKTLTAEPKIAEAYHMLKRQGIISEDPVGPDDVVEEQPPPPREDTLFKDEEKQKLLQRLLRSKNPEDHQAANRLIKTIVKEEEERREKGLKRMSELEKVDNNVKLLQEMIDAFSGDPSNSNADRELMKELFEECERLRPNLFKLASDADDKDESIADILKANDNLVKVLEAYQTQVVAVGGSGAVVKLLDVSEGDSSNTAPAASDQGAAAASGAASDLLSDDLQSLGLDSPSTMINPTPVATTTKTTTTTAAAPELPSASPTGAAKDLAGIFKSNDTSASLDGLLPFQPTAVASVAVPSSSSPTVTATASSNHSASTTSTVPHPTSNASPDWTNLSKVFSSLEPTTASDKSPIVSTEAASVDIFESLKNVEEASTSILLDAALDAGSSTGIGNEATLLQPKNTSTLPVTTQNGAVNPAAAAPKDPAATASSSKGFDDINLMSRGLLENTMKEFGVAKKGPLLEGPLTSCVPTKLTLAELQKRKEDEAKQKQHLAPLSSVGEGDAKKLPDATPPPPAIPTSPSLDNVTVKLEAVKPSSSLAPISLYDQHGLKILLFFAQVSSYPSPDIAVAILTTMSTNTLPLKAYHLKASAGKLTPVRLEAPTAKELPPFNPILPPSAISQILLVANPNKEPVKLNFELSFILGETTYSDVGESPEFPQKVFP